MTSNSMIYKRLTSSFFFSELSPISFNCVSMRFLKKKARSDERRHWEEQDVHLSADEFQPLFDV